MATKKKHPDKHLVVHQTGHRVVSHDMQGNILHTTPWTVTSSYNPMMIDHTDEMSETPDDDATLQSMMKK